jgi:CsoR family transcriptional regulator, copper-sensing transcriptional repressor
MKQGVSHDNVLVALRRIEGQVRGIQQMIDKRRYCVDILNAVAAARGALKKVEAVVLKDHLNACARKAFEGRSVREKEAKLREIMGLFESLRK